MLDPVVLSQEVPCRLASRLHGSEGKATLLVDDDSGDSYLPPRAPLLASLEFEHAILHLIDSNGPLGSGTLMEELQDLGYHGSEPTVGRFLRTLDRRGLSARISNKGRHLTETGRKRLRELCEAEDQLYYERELIRTMRSNTIDDLLDVLVARRALERESARLAAERATSDEIILITDAIQEHRRVLATSGLAMDADEKVHSLIAQAGCNRVLAAAIDLIRRDKQLAVALDAILQHTDHKYVVGHERILKAISRRAPDEAERAMLDHINTLITDVQHYRENVVMTHQPPVLSDSPAAKIVPRKER